MPKTRASENPFYGKSKLLSLYQMADKPGLNMGHLNIAYASCENKEDREVFWSILFNVGEITNRDHNVFEGNKVDEGGNANSVNWLIILLWMLKTHVLQFIQFLPLIVEYVGLRELTSLEVRTVKKKTTVIGFWGLLKEIMQVPKAYEALLQLLQQYVTSHNPFHRLLVAKFISLPRTTGRKYKDKKGTVKKTKLQPITIEKNSFYKRLLMDLSTANNWIIDSKIWGIYFSGFISWRKEYLKLTEHYLFSTKAILEMDKVQFLQWLNTIPASARDRVRRRLLTKDNILKGRWKRDEEDLGQWFLDWEKFKETKQKEVREITAKISEGTATEKEVATLVKVKKEAKVTTGGNVNFGEMFKEIILGTVDSLKLQPFLEKFSLHGMSFLPIIDVSGSMSNRTQHGFSAFDFGTFMSTILLHLSKSKDLIGTFSSGARFFQHIGEQTIAKNSLMNLPTTKVAIPLYDERTDFLSNLSYMRKFITSISSPSSTDILSIPKYLANWVKQSGNEALAIETISQYPVWVIMTDGEFNSLSSPASSMSSFMMTCEREFGFKPFVIAIDVSNNSAKAEKFEGIENFMLLQPNPAAISNFLTNFNDMEIVDVYTPLLSIHRSSRKAPIRANTL